MARGSPPVRHVQLLSLKMAKVATGKPEWSTPHLRVHVPSSTWWPRSL